MGGALYRMPMHNIKNNPKTPHWQRYGHLLVVIEGSLRTQGVGLANGSSARDITITRTRGRRGGNILLIEPLAGDTRNGNTLALFLYAVNNRSS